MIPGTVNPPLILGSVQGDPYLGYVSSLLHFDGADASTTFTDQTGKIWTPAGDAQLDTAQFKFGTASGLFDGTGDKITTPDHIDWTVGSGDFTIEFWMRPSEITLGKTLLSKVGNTNYSPYLIYKGAAALQFFASTGTGWDVASAQSIGTVATGSWFFVTVCRSGSNFYTFLDGVQGSTWTNASTLYNNPNPVTIGFQDAVDYYAGWVDEFRFTKGFARYTQNFTPPTAPFPNP